MKKGFSLFFVLLSLNLFAQNQKVGVGVMLGEPTGISVKIWRNGTYDFKAVLHDFQGYARLWIYTKSFWIPKKNAFSLSAAVPVFPEGDYHVHCDYLWHCYTIFPPDVGMIAAYYGVGVRFRHADESHIGARLVSGVNYFIPGIPWDVYMELAPVVDAEPKFGLDLNVGMGIRYNF